MDYRETQRFIAKLHAPDEPFEVAYIKPDGPVRRVERTLSESLFEEMGRAEASGFNVYASALPVALQTVGYDRVWVDQDDPSAPFPFAADDRWDGAQWPEPTTLVKTSDAEGGFRWQAIWKLNETLSLEAGRAFVKKLAKRAGADEAVHDPRRVLRVPGLINAKRGSMSRLISTSEGEVSTAGFDLPTESAVEALLNMEVNNPAHVLGEWLDGTTEGDRNRKAYVAARFLKSCGVSIEDAGPILKLGAMRSNPPLDDHELAHSLKSAYYRA